MKDQFKSLLKIKNFLDEFCVGDFSTWKDRILLEAVNNDSFVEFFLSVIEILENINNLKLEKLFLKLRELSLENIKNFNENDDIITKYKNFLQVELYYGIIEQIDEMSTLSENTYKALMQKYGYDYISKLDKENPSKLTNFYSEQNNSYEDEDVKIYLTLKKWQDLQNEFSNDILTDVLHIENIEENLYKNHLKQIDAKVTFRNKFELLQLFKKSAIEINTLSKYYAIGLLDGYKKFIGGKAYGLAILNCYTSIPETYVVSYKTENVNILPYLNKGKKYAVRSSADCEDGTNHSFAGMFTSYLDVDAQNVNEAIEKVKNSVSNSKVQEYVKKFELNEPNMNVVVQEFINPDVSGVWLGSDMEKGIYETVNGVGEDLVSGKKVPTTHNFSEQDEMCIKFVDLQQKIGSVCDFEFCVKNNELTMLQCRPVTTAIKTEIIKKDGIGVSCGEVVGDVVFIEDADEYKKVSDNQILVTYATDPNWVPAILESKGIVTLFGGYLCHTAIVARELNIPCVVGVDRKLFQKICKAKKIKINGDTGEVLILE